jgi:hypothetical protein
MDLHYKKKMSAMTSDNTEMAAKITAGTADYRFSDLDAVVLKYNLWYDKKFPGKVKYLPVAAKDPVELVPIGDDFVTIGTKEELKKYLAQKAWETVSITPYDGTGNKPLERVIGIGKLKSAYRYSIYKLFSSGKAQVEGASGVSGTWDAKDGTTITINGTVQIYNITGITTSTFTGDVKSPLSGIRETIMFRVQKELTEKD